MKSISILALAIPESISQLKPLAFMSIWQPSNFVTEPFTSFTSRRLGPKLDKGGTSICQSQALYDRRPTGDNSLIHHSDRGSQYLSSRYSEWLAEAGIEPSVGSRGDSYDNALAETINGLYKTELIHRRGPWKTRESVEMATLHWVHWFNHHRLLEPIGYIPPAEAEANYWQLLAEKEKLAA